MSGSVGAPGGDSWGDPAHFPHHFPHHHFPHHFPSLRCSDSRRCSVITPPAPIADTVSRNSNSFLLAVLARTPCLWNIDATRRRPAILTHGIHSSLQAWSCQRPITYERPDGRKRYCWHPPER